MSPSLVNWMTSMMTMRLQVVLEHLPLTSTNIQQYIVLTQVPTSPVFSPHNVLVVLRHRGPFQRHNVTCQHGAVDARPEIIVGFPNV